VALKLKDSALKDGLLISHSASTSLIQVDQNKIISVKNDRIVFDKIPKHLLQKPSLIWNVKTSKDTQTTLKIDYLIKNISFKSDYILDIEKNSANLQGWLSINNLSGKAFKDTKLSFVAGDINKAQKDPHILYKTNVLRDSPRVAEKSFEGYHLYRVPFRVDLRNNEKTQIKFLSAKIDKISKTYEAKMRNPLYLIGERSSDIEQYVGFKTKQPMPKGVVRIYSKDMQESILLGESKIPHTPKNSTLKLKIGKNFDTKVLQRVLKRDDDSKYFRVEVEYEVINNSDEDKTITLFIPFNKKRYSKIKTSHKYSFTKGNLVTIRVDVKSNTNKKIVIYFESIKA